MLAHRPSRISACDLGCRSDLELEASPYCICYSAKHQKNTHHPGILRKHLSDCIVLHPTKTEVPKKTLRPKPQNPKYLSNLWFTASKCPAAGLNSQLLRRPSAAESLQLWLSSGLRALGLLGPRVEVCRARTAWGTL